MNIEKADFVAIDFEHATREKGTVCSIGIVTFKSGEIVDEFFTLIKPPHNKYEWFTTRVHKLDSTHTANSPTFQEAYQEISKRLRNNTLVAHGAFHTDRHCLEQAMGISGIKENLNISWECTQEICNAKLDVASMVCKIELDHHDALSDAKACGIIFSMYLKKILPIEQIQIERGKAKDSNPPNKKIYPKSLKGQVLNPDFENVKNKETPFFMKKIVISGFSDSQKVDLANMLKDLGADIDSSIGKKTNFLLIGETPGPSKLKKMQENISEGRDAKIITLNDFQEMINGINLSD
jgi:DNA polymerase-3 subunit epsilon